MNLDRLIERQMKDPEKRVKLYIAFNLGIFLVNLAIIFGLGVLFLRYSGFF